MSLVTRQRNFNMNTEKEDGSFTTTFEEALELGIFDPYQFNIDDYDFIEAIRKKGKLPC